MAPFCTDAGLNEVSEGILLKGYQVALRVSGLRHRSSHTTLNAHVRHGFSRLTIPQCCCHRPQTHCGSGGGATHMADGSTSRCEKTDVFVISCRVRALFPRLLHGLACKPSDLGLHRVALLLRGCHIITSWPIHVGICTHACVYTHA